MVVDLLEILPDWRGSEVRCDGIDMVVYFGLLLIFVYLHFLGPCYTAEGRLFTYFTYRHTQHGQTQSISFRISR